MSKMRTPKTKTKGFHLNGNTGWFTVCVFITAQTVSGLLSFGRMTATVDQIEKKLDDITITVADNRKEAREDIKALEQQLHAIRLLKRSA